jgi:hypothetical protein
MPRSGKKGKSRKIFLLVRHFPSKCKGAALTAAQAGHAAQFRSMVIRQ